jgi:hypothetical protein
LSLLRPRLRERTLVLQEKKLALEQARLQLEAAPQPPPKSVPEPPESPLPSIDLAKAEAEPPREPAPIANSPFTPAKPPQKHTAPAPNPNLKTQLYDEKHNFSHLLRGLQDRIQFAARQFGPGRGESDEHIRQGSVRSEQRSPGTK